MRQLEYRGRVAVYEAMPIDSPLRALILERASPDALAACAAGAGMLTLRHGALLHMARGVTSMDEVVRNT